MKFALLLLVLTAEIVFAGDWPRFLGPFGNATSPETGLADKWPASGPPRVWIKAVGTGYSAPSIVSNKLVLFHRLGDEEVIEALHPSNGTSIWKHAYPSKFVDPYGYNNGPRCTPLLTNGFCYTFGAEGKLACVALDTGKLVWQLDTAAKWNIPEAFFGVGSTPLLEGNVLIVMLGAQPNSGVIGLNPTNGTVVWENVGKSNWDGQPMLGWPGERTVVWREFDKQASYASPVAATIHGKRHVFCLMRQGLVSLNPTNGQVNFSRWFRARVEESVNAANPVVVDDMVFISAAYYRVGSVLLKINPDGKSFTELWASTALEAHWSTPVYDKGYLYSFSGRNEPDSIFRCIELKTGKVMWERDERWNRTTRTPPVYGRGALIAADGKLIALGEGGLLGLFKITHDKAEELSRFQVPELAYPCWAGPVLSDKKVYLRSEKALCCYNLGKN